MYKNCLSNKCICGPVLLQSRFSIFLFYSATYGDRITVITLRVLHQQLALEGRNGKPENNLNCLTL